MKPSRNSALQLGQNTLGSPVVGRFEEAYRPARAEASAGAPCLLRSPADDRADHEERLGAARDGVGERSVG